MSHFKKGLIVFIFTISQFLCFAQNDTIYINRWGARVSKDSANYFRFMHKESEHLYKIEDHFLTGQIQMTGYCTSEEAVINTGKYIFYDSLGYVISEGHYTKGFKSGVWTYYYPQSVLIKQVYEYLYPEKGAFTKKYDSLTHKITEQGYLDEKAYSDGEWKYYFHNSDSISRKYYFVHGRKEGLQYEYYKSSAVKRIEEYENFKFKQGKQFDEDGNKIKYFPRVQYPQPNQSIFNFLSKKVKCFDSSMNGGKFTIKLMVHSDGSLSDIEVLHVADEVCRKAIIEAIGKMRKWKPYKYENVASNYLVERNLRYYTGKD